MSMARSLCVMVGLLVAGCSSAEQDRWHTPEFVAPERQQTGNIAMKPTPPEYAEQVQRAELLGRAIYQKDLLAANATDALMARGSSSTKAKVGGWTTLADGEKWVVYFFDRSRRNPTIFQEVSFPDSSGKSPKISESGSRPVLEKTAMAMFRARGTAFKAQFQTCSRNYNSVVLPAELAGEKGWYVYLLAATTKSGVAVLGGHARVHVSADGKKILNVKEFTKSCINMPIADKNSIGLMISHIVDKHPVETHVFMSLLYRVQLFVVTSSHSWVIQKGSIGLASF